MKRALVKVCHGKNDLIGYRTIGSVAGQILGGTQQILPSSSALDRRQLLVVSLLERKGVYIAQPPSSFISSSPAQTLPVSKPPLHTSPYSFPQSQPPTFSFTCTDHPNIRPRDTALNLWPLRLYCSVAGYRFVYLCFLSRLVSLLW